MKTSNKSKITIINLSTVIGFFFSFEKAAGELYFFEVVATVRAYEFTESIEIYLFRLDRSLLSNEKFENR